MSAAFCQEGGRITETTADIIFLGDTFTSFKATPHKTRGLKNREKKWYNKSMNKQMSLSFIRKEGGASEIICQGKGRTRICGHKGAIPVSKNAIPGSAKTDRQTEYAVRAGELGSG